MVPFSAIMTTPLPKLCGSTSVPALGYLARSRTSRLGQCHRKKLNCPCSVICEICLMIAIGISNLPGHLSEIPKFNVILLRYRERFICPAPGDDDLLVIIWKETIFLEFCDYLLLLEFSFNEEADGPSLFS